MEMTIKELEKKYALLQLRSVLNHLQTTRLDVVAGGYYGRLSQTDDSIDNLEQAIAFFKQP